MKGGFATQRRADRFDALVSGHATDTAGADAEFLELVAAMREMPPVEARPEFVSSLRERLVDEAAAMPWPSLDPATVEHLSLHQSTVHRERRIATVLGGLAVASATASMAVASQGALPGETLYPVKRAIENAESTLQSGEAERASTLLDHAEQRLAEARELTADGSDGTEVAEALDALNGQSREAASLTLSDYRESGDPQGVTDLRAFTTKAIAELTSMSEQVPDAARASLIGAVHTLRNIDGAATQACPACVSAAEAPDPELVAHLESLLSGDGAGLQSLARTAEEMAAGTPDEEATPTSEASPSTPPPESPDSPSASELPTSTVNPDLATRGPESTPAEKDPVTTLLDEVENDLEGLNQKAEQENWTLLDNALTDSLDLTDGTE